MTKKPTPGPWTSAGPKVYGRIPYALVQVCTMDWSDAANPSAEDALNTDLILAAGTSAHQLYESGYDGLAAVKALPEIMQILSEVDSPRTTKQAAAWRHRVRRTVARLTKKETPDDDT